MDFSLQILIAILVITGVAILSILIYLVRQSRQHTATGDLSSTDIQEWRSRLDRETATREGLEQQLKQEKEAHQTTREHLQQANNDKGKLQARVEEEAKLREGFAQQVKDTFATLAQDALSKNKDDFMQLANERFTRLQDDSKAELKKREQAVEGLVKPIREALTQTEQKINNIEKARTEAYGAIEQQLKRMGEDQNKLTSETGKLVSALRRPQVRGRYGELGLRRVVELAGMNSYCDFQEQTHSTDDEGQSIRPDMILRLPSNRTLVVDAKMPLEHYLNAIEAEDEDQRKQALVEHAKSVRQHVNTLGKKNYWAQFPQSPDFVVMFINGEQFLTAALEQDVALLEDAMDKKIILATPASLMGLLRAVAYGWRQEDIAENAREIQSMGKTLLDRIITFTEHFANIGKGLRRSADSYSKAVGSLERNLTPMARKLQDYGIQSKKSLPDDIQGEDIPIRQLSSSGDDSE